MKPINILATTILVLISISNIYSQSKDSLYKIKKAKYVFIPTNLDSIKKLNDALIWTKNGSLKNNSFSSAAQKAIMPYFHKTFGQNMQGKASDKFGVRQCHLLFEPVLPVILVVKSHVLMVKL
jgi:hypothetical protein